MIIDLDNVVLKQNLRNTTYAIGNISDTLTSNTLSQREILRIAQFDTNTVRIVVQGENCKNYRLVTSPDGNSLYIAKRQDVLNSKLTQFNSVPKNYSTSKTQNTNSLNLNFSEPVALSVFEENNIAYLDIQNSNFMNETEFQKAIQNTYFNDAKQIKIASDKFRIQKPIPLNTSYEVKTNLTHNNITLNFVPDTKINKDPPQVEKKPTLIGKKLEISGKYTVVIDAGHGGEDYGAIRFNTNEKDLNLSLAKLVEKNLKDKKIHTKMIRDKDFFVELAQRSETANNIKPDVFVSIHHNASLKDEIKGIETHWWREDSIQLAEIVHKHLTKDKNLKEWNTPNRGLYKSQFYVINHTEAPSILLELGFMSNEEELKRIKDKDVQEKEARAIADGIIEYLKSRGKK